MDNDDQGEVDTLEHSASDPLLDALLIIAKLKGKSISRDVILSGLPLTNNKLTLDLFSRAGVRCGFSSEIVLFPLEKVKAKLLPIIFLLNNKETCVITKIENDVAEVIRKNTKEVVAKVTLSELEKEYSGYAIVIQESYKLDRRTKEFAVDEPKHWFWEAIRGAWGTYSEILVASFLINLFAVSVPLFVMNVYDRVVPNNALETLWVLSIGMLIIIGFEFLMRTLRGYYIDTAGRKIDLKLSSKTFAQVLGLAMKDRPNSIGSLANTIQSFESFREFITSASISLLIDLPFSLLFVIVILFINPLLALVPIFSIPVILSVSYFLQKPIGILVAKSYRHAAEKQALLVEAIGASESIKCLNAEGIHLKKWEKIVDESSRLSLKVRRLANFGMNFATSVQFLSLVAIVIAGVYAIGIGELSIGGLIACTILSGRSLAPIVQAANLLIRYKQSKASLDALDSIMRKSVDRPDDAQYINFSSIKGEIEFKEVEFTYPDEPIPAIDKISIKARPGDKIGIIGKAGSGKSTLAKLILKLYQPDKGHVFIDDVDVRQIDSALLRKHIGYIPQDIDLFHGSIRENITMGAQGLSDDMLLAVAKISGVHQFVSNHPDGYDRQVGERGSFLSGGQQQAVAIARSLVQDPEIYLFDEPTKSLDNVRIKYFIEQMKRILKNKTLIVITHKTSVLSLVDYLIVMDRGKIFAQGPKEKIFELLKNKNG